MTLVLVHPSPDEIVAFNMQNPHPDPAYADPAKIRDMLVGSKHNPRDKYQIAPKWGTLIYKLYAQRRFGKTTPFHIVLRDPSMDERNFCSYNAYEIVPVNPDSPTKVLRGERVVEFKHDVKAYAINPFYADETKKQRHAALLHDLLAAHTNADLSNYDALVAVGRKSCYVRRDNKPQSARARFRSAPSPVNRISRRPTPVAPRAFSAPSMQQQQQPRSRTRSQQPQQQSVRRSSQRMPYA